MITGIKCCKGCVAPKRYPGCHSNCPEYLTEKKQWDEQKKIISEQRQAYNNLYEQRSRGVHKALRKKKGYK